MNVYPAAESVGGVGVKKKQDGKYRALIQTLTGLRSQWSICHFVYSSSTPRPQLLLVRACKIMMIIFKEREKEPKLITSAMGKYDHP